MSDSNDKEVCKQCIQPRKFMNKEGVCIICERVNKNAVNKENI